MRESNTLNDYLMDFAAAVLLLLYSVGYSHKVFQEIEIFMRHSHSVDINFFINLMRIALRIAIVALGVYPIAKIVIGSIIRLKNN